MLHLTMMLEVGKNETNSIHFGDDDEDEDNAKKKKKKRR